MLQTAQPRAAQLCNLNVVLSLRYDTYDYTETVQTTDRDNCGSTLHHLRDTVKIANFYIPPLLAAPMRVIPGRISERGLVCSKED